MEVLEENISRVEARIRELENPQEQGPPVLLSDPYSANGSSSNLGISTVSFILKSS